MTIYASQVLSGAALNYRAVLSALSSEIGAKVTEQRQTGTVLVTGTTPGTILAHTVAVDEDEILFGVFNANIAQYATPSVPTSYIRITVDARESESTDYLHKVVASIENARGTTAFCARAFGEGKVGGGNVVFTALMASQTVAGAEMRAFNAQWLSFVLKKQKYNDRIFT